MENKYLYVIGASGGPLKIGIADDVHVRRGTLNIGNPKYLRVLIKHELDSEEAARILELQLHYCFQDYHVRGEWFDLTESDLPNIRKEISLVKLFDFVPDGWSLARKSCDEFTATVCKIARLGLGLSTKKLSELTGICEATINIFEAGKTCPNMTTLETIKGAFESQGVEFIRETAGERLRVLI